MSGIPQSQNSWSLGTRQLGVSESKLSITDKGTETKLAKAIAWHVGLSLHVVYKGIKKGEGEGERRKREDQGNEKSQLLKTKF